MYNAPPQQQPVAPGQPQPGIDWGIIGEGFRLLFAHWQTYCAAGAVVFASIIPLGLVWGVMVVFAPQNPDAFAASFAAMMAVLVVGGLLMLAIQAVIAAGVVNFTLKVSRNLPATTSDLWIGFKRPLPFVTAILIEIFASIVGVCACLVGSVIVAGLLMFVFPLMVDQKLGPWEATQKSWEMLKSEWLMVGVFMFVLQMISQLGSYACYVGLILTMPYLYIAPTLLYNRYMGYGVQAAYNPTSPYPRGQGAGYGIGQEGPPKP